jgi:hypothetical protein
MSNEIANQWTRDCHAGRDCNNDESGTAAAAAAIVGDDRDDKKEDNNDAEYVGGDTDCSELSQSLAAPKGRSWPRGRYSCRCCHRCDNVLVNRGAWSACYGRYRLR